MRRPRGSGGLGEACLQPQEAAAELRALRREVAERAAEQPYDDWLHAGLLRLDDLPDRNRELPDGQSLAIAQRLFGYTEEERRVILGPMARAGAEPIGSVGSDTPLAALSDRPRLIFD